MGFDSEVEYNLENVKWITDNNFVTEILWCTLYTCEKRILSYLRDRRG
jgi:hypothetical protein